MSLSYVLVHFWPHPFYSRAVFVQEIILIDATMHIIDYIYWA